MEGFVRELSAGEVASLALPLRARVFHDELRWVHHEVSDPESLRDAFDAEAIHLGFFGEAALAGTLRLIIRRDVVGLPSGPFLASVRSFVGACGEVSKLVVDKPFRYQGVRRRLLTAAFPRAAAAGVRNLFLGATGEFPLYLRYGFSAVGEPFLFADDHIAPPVRSQMFLIDPSGAER